MKSQLKIVHLAKECYSDSESNNTTMKAEARKSKNNDSEKSKENKKENFRIEKNGSGVTVIFKVNGSEVSQRVTEVDEDFFDFIETNS